MPSESYVEPSGSFVEGDRAVAALDWMLSECRRGEVRLASVSGAPGTGKTTLVRRFVQNAENSGALTLTAAGSGFDEQAEIDVVSQLLRTDSICARHGRRVDELLSHVGFLTSSRLLGNALLLLTDVLVHLTKRAPVVVLVVDDADRADAGSLLCLSLIAERLWRYPIAMVFTEVAGDGLSLPHLDSMMFTSPNVVRVRCRPLSEAAVDEFLGTHLARDGARPSARAWYRFSGGNPLLLRAMLDSQQLAGAPDDVDSCFGPAFRAAVLTCLRRCDPRANHIAQALVQLGENTSHHILARVVETETATVRRVVRLLDEGGLLENGKFRHPEIRSAVESSSTATQRQRLHHRAAEVLLHDGAPLTRIADQLVKAIDNQVDDSGYGDGWQIQALLDAVSECRSMRRVDDARRYFTTALRLSTDAQWRASILTAQVAWERELSSEGVVPHLDELKTAMREGHLGARQSQLIVKELLFHGREVEALRALEEAAGRLLPEDLTSISRWIAVNMPGALVRSTGLRPDPPTAASLNRAFGDAHDFEELAVTVLHGVLTQSLDADEALLIAEYVLRGCLISRQPPEVAEMAVLVLIYLDRAPAASLWCERLLDDSAGLSQGTYASALGAVRAEAALRQGFVRQAAEFARQALEGPAVSGSPYQRGPVLAALIMALVGKGELPDAEELVRSGLPQGAAHDRWELHYLQARGHFLRSTGQAVAALGDFRACGELMRRWNMDLPSLVPWKLEMARTYLILGTREKAKEMVEEQLALLPPGQSRTRGMTLRTLAAVREPRERLSLLREAVEALRAAGDHREASGALAELSLANHDRGSLERARRTARQADEELARCDEGSAALASKIPVPWEDEVRVLAKVGNTAGALSGAEYRVACLAAKGVTNREIARQLFITQSTVEQHLTHVYRKLSVRRRGQLSEQLDLMSSSPSPGQGCRRR